MSEITGEELYDDEEDEILYHNELNNTLDSVESLKLTCSICYRGFNIFSRIPTIITACGHSTCSECMDKIDNCPICRKNIDETIVNWAIYSELKVDKGINIDPFYKIFIDFKSEIEEDYLRYPDTPINVNFDELSSSQKKLINKIKFRIKDIKIKDYMFENLLIPNWISNKIKQTNINIQGYKTRLSYFGLEGLEDQLPFCP